MRLDVCNLSTKRASSEPWSLLYGLSKAIISINMHFNERMHASVSVSASHGQFSFLRELIWPQFCLLLP